jgi:hypothetical protein
MFVEIVRVVGPVAAGEAVEGHGRACISGWQSSQIPKRWPPQSTWVSVARQPLQKCSPIWQYGHSECVNSLGIDDLIFFTETVDVADEVARLEELAELDYVFPGSVEVQAHCV